MMCRASFTITPSGFRMTSHLFSSSTKIGHMDNVPSPLFHELLLTRLSPSSFCICKHNIQWSKWCALPNTLLVFIDMKTAFILKQWNNPFFSWSQDWINMHKLRFLKNPLGHLFLVQCHCWEECVLAIFNDIGPLMAIHINTLFQPCVSPPKPDQPSQSCALRQPALNCKPKCWENVLIKSVMEELWGDLTRGQV